MGNKQSKSQKVPLLKTDKIVNDEKLLKIGLGLGRGDIRIEGNFQMGWHRRCNKNYRRSVSEETDLIPITQEDDTEDTQV